MKNHYSNDENEKKGKKERMKKKKTTGEKVKGKEKNRITANKYTKTEQCQW